MTTASGHPSVMVLGAGFSTGNLGVNALLSGAVRGIRDAMPRADIAVLDYAYEPSVLECRVGGQRVPLDLVNIRFSKKLLLSNNIARLLLLAAASRVVPRSLRQRWLGRNPTLRRILACDVACSIAGGDSFSDIYGIGRLLYVSLPQVLMILLGKPLIQLPQTIGPFKSRIGVSVARYIVRHSARVYARDKAGVETLTRMVGTRGPEPSFCHDVAFRLEPAEPAGTTAHQDAGVRVGINISGLLYMGGYTQRNMFDLQIDYPAALLRILRGFLQNPSVSVALVPHVFGPGNGESDCEAAEALLERLEPELRSRVELIPGVYDHHEMKAIIGTCDFFVGSRMHACIGALSQGIPAVGISYSPKFAGVFESLGMSELVADPTRLTEDDIVSLVEDRYRRREEFAGRLQMALPQVTERLRQVFVDIGQECIRARAA